MSRQTELEELKTKLIEQFSNYFQLVKRDDHSPALFGQQHISLSNLSLSDMCERDLLKAINEAKDVMALTRILNDDDTNIWARNLNFAPCFEKCLFLIMSALPALENIKALIIGNLSQFGSDGKATKPATRAVVNAIGSCISLSEMQQELTTTRPNMPICRALSNLVHIRPEQALECAM